MQHHETGLCVAIVDDDEIYRDYIAMMLGRLPGVVILQASSGAQLFELMRTHAIDCILLDHNLGFESGLAITSQLKTNFREPPPVVMLTGDNKQTTAIRAFRIGVSDYLPKQDLTQAELTRVVTDTAARSAEARRHEEEHHRLLRQSQYDAITGLYSRMFIDERLAELGARNASMGLPFALILIEFKEWPEIAGQFGSVVGDHALKAFAGRLKTVTLATDICGHYHDGTFVYLVDRDVGPNAMISFQVRLTHELLAPMHLDQLSLVASAVVGAGFCPRDGTSAEELIQAASASPALVGGEGSEPAEASTSETRDRIAVAGGASSAQKIQSSAAPFVAERSADRRRAPRHKVLKQGTIVLENGTRVECTIRDLSQLGAKLIVDDYFVAPEHFALVIVGSGDKKRVRCCWRMKNAVGVEFE